MRLARVRLDDAGSPAETMKITSVTRLRKRRRSRDSVSHRAISDREILAYVPNRNERGFCRAKDEVERRMERAERVVNSGPTSAFVEIGFGRWMRGMRKVREGGGKVSGPEQVEQ